MKYLNIFIKQEVKRLLKSPVILIFCILFLLFSLIFTYVGIGQYRCNLNKMEKFLELENAKVNHYVTYTQYGTYGIGMMFVPRPISLFFVNSTPIPGITAYADSGERLKIYHSLKGKHIFELKKYGFTDFSGIILVFGSLLSLFYSIDILRNREYTKFLASLIKSGKLFILLMITRIIIVFVLLIFIIMVNLILIFLNGLSLPLDGYFFIFISMILLIILFFFVLGAVFSTLSARINSYINGIAVWFILVFIIPAAILYYITWNTQSLPPVEDLEMKKFELVMNFEKRAIEKAGTFNYKKKVTIKREEVIKEYLKNELGKLNLLEKVNREEIKKSIDYFYKLSNFFPTSFYLSVTNEISSNGYNNLLNFQKKVQYIKNGFIKFILDKIYFSDGSSNFAKVESYLKGKENIYNANSDLPPGTVVGFTLTIFYTIVFFGIAFKRFKRVIVRLPMLDENQSREVAIPLKSGDFKVVVSDDENFKQKVYNYFVEPEIKLEGKNIKITIEEDTINKEKTPESIYICHPDNLPGDIKFKDFIIFMIDILNLSHLKRYEVLNNVELKELLNKKIKRLRRIDKGKLLIQIIQMTKKDIYLVNDASRGLPVEIVFALKESFDEYRRNGSIILYLVSTDIVLGKAIPGSDAPTVYDSPHWGSIMNHYKKLFDI